MKPVKAETRCPAGQGPQWSKGQWNCYTVSPYKPKLPNNIWYVSYSGQNLNVCKMCNSSVISVDKWKLMSDTEKRK